MSDEYDRRTNRWSKGVAPVFMRAFAEIIGSLPPSVGVESISVEHEGEGIVQGELEVKIGDYEGRAALERLAEAFDVYRHPRDAPEPAYRVADELYIRRDDAEEIVENGVPDGVGDADGAAEPAGDDADADE